jgi:CBS domain-containing protein
MRQPALTCPATMTLASAADRMRTSGCGTLAVLDGHGRLAGIVTDRDLALAISRAAEAPQITMAEVMTSRVHICGPDDDLRQALAEMRRWKVRRLPVVDRQGDVIGMISVDDIALWGLGESGVSSEELIAALRAICVKDAAVLQDTLES